MPESPNFLRDDPSARAAYSGNPGFTEGVEYSHPISCENKSLLAQPDIAEGMEAMYLAEAGQLEAASEPDIATVAPLDFELARSGLTTIRKTIKDESGRSTKERAISTKSQLIQVELKQEEKQEQELTQQQAAEARAREEEADQEFLAGLEKAATALRERIDREIQENQERLEASIMSVQLLQPHLNFEQIRSLGTQYPMVGGNVLDEAGEHHPISEKTWSRSMAPYFSGIRAGYMEDPARLWGDMKAVSTLYDWAKKANEDVAFTYAQTFSDGVIKPLDKEFYFCKDFTPEIAQKWLLCMAGEGGVQSPRGEGENGQFDKEVDIHGVAARFGERILANSLSTVARQQPGKLIDVLHAVVEQGLGSENPELRRAAGDLMLLNIYDDSLAYIFLYMSGISGNPKIQRKALDMYASLELVKGQSALPTQREVSALAARMNREESRIFATTFKRELSRCGRSKGAFSMEVDEQRGRNLEAFRQAVEAGDAPDTIYARLQSAGL
jgi:hypothetical protein